MTPPLGERWEADVAALDRLHAVLEQTWRDHPEVPELDRTALTLSLAELVANVAEHSGATSLWFGVEVTATALVAVTQDDGVPTPHRFRSALVTEDPYAEDGRGMALARHLSELTYDRVGACNRWQVIRPIATS